MSETKGKSLLLLVMTSSGCSVYGIRAGVGSLSYKAHISAVNVPLPISFFFHEYLDVAGAVFRPEEYLYSFHFDSGSILARAGISKRSTTGMKGGAFILEATNCPSGNGTGPF